MGFKIGTYLDPDFADLDKRTINDTLDSLCYDKSEGPYTRNLTEDELTIVKDNLAEISIKIAELEKERKRIMDEMRSSIKDKKEELATFIDNVKFKTEHLEGVLWWVDDPETKTMYFFDDQGICVDSRPLLASEKQTKIRNLKKAENE